MFIDFQRFSTFFNDFQRFLGARPYRGVSRQSLRIFVAQKAKTCEKVRKKSDTIPTEKPTGAPPEVGFQASSCPSDFRRTFCSSNSTGEGPILAEKVSAKCRTDMRTFFRTKIAFSPDNSANSERKKRKICTGNFIFKPSILRFAAVLPNFARSCPNLPDLEVPSDPVRRRSLTRRSTGGRSYAPRKLPQTTTTTNINAAMGRLIGSLYI